MTPINLEGTVMEGIMTTIKQQMAALGGNATEAITAALPYIIGVVGAGVIISIGIKWVKKIKG